MTLPLAGTVSDPYVASGTQSDFSFPYRFFTDADLQVLVYTDGVPTIKTLNVDYTVTGANLPEGGTVSFVTPPVEDTVVVIRRLTVLEQAYSYITGGNFPAVSHELLMDRFIGICQELQGQIDRTLILPLRTSYTGAVPDLTTNGFLRNTAGVLTWDDTLDPIFSSDEDTFIVGKSTGCDTLAEALTTIGSTVATLVLSPGQHIATGLTIPSTLHLKVLNGAEITYGNSNFTVNGFLSAGSYKIFYPFGTGQLVWNSPTILLAKWMMLLDGTDEATEFNAAMQALVNGGGGQMYLMGNLGYNADIYLREGVEILTAGPELTILTPLGDVSLTTTEDINGALATSRRYALIGSCTIDMSTLALDSTGFKVQHELNDCDIGLLVVEGKADQFQRGFHFAQATGTKMYNNRIELLLKDCASYDGAFHVEILSGESTCFNMNRVRLQLSGTYWLGLNHEAGHRNVYDVYLASQPQSPVLSNGSGGRGLWSKWGNEIQPIGDTESHYDNVVLGWFGELSAEIGAVTYKMGATHNDPIFLHCQTITAPSVVLELDYTFLFAATQTAGTTCTIVGDQTADFKNGHKIGIRESDAWKYGTLSIDSTYDGGSGLTTLTFNEAGILTANLEAIIRCVDYDSWHKSSIAIDNKAESYRNGLTVNNLTVNSVANVPVLFANSCTQTSQAGVGVADVAASILNMPASWFAVGKTFRITVIGTKSGANAAMKVHLYLRNGIVLTLTAGDAAAGDWMTTFWITEHTGTSNQKIGGKLEVTGKTPIIDSAAGTKAITAQPTPIKVQIESQNAGDTVTVEQTYIEGWKLV